MANEYTPNFRYRMPAIGDEFWADEFYQNQEIKDAVTKNHLVGAKVSGLLVTVNSGLSISWEAGQVFVNEIIHTVNSGSAVLPPSGNVDILVPVYIYTDGINVVVSTVVPTLTNGTLLAIADTDTQQIVALADTRVIGELFEQNDTFYVDPNGDDNASGSATEPWQTIQGSIDNIKRKNFTSEITKATLSVSIGEYTYDRLIISSLAVGLHIKGASAPENVVFINTDNTSTINVQSKDVIIENITTIQNLTTADNITVNYGGTIELRDCIINGGVNGLQGSHASQIKCISSSIGGCSSYAINLFSFSTAEAYGVNIVDCNGILHCLEMSHAKFDDVSVLYSTITGVSGTYFLAINEQSSLLADIFHIDGNNISIDNMVYSIKGSTIRLSNSSVSNATLYTEAHDSSFIDYVTFTGHSVLSPGADTVGNALSYIKKAI